MPQVPLDAIPAVAPQVTYEGGLLTIVAPNSTLADILRGVRKHTSAEIEIPATANERVVTRLGPAPAREVMAELLNGSHFNYILLGLACGCECVGASGAGSEDAGHASRSRATVQPQAPVASAPVAEPTAEEVTDESADQSAAEAEEPAPPPPPEQPGVKTPQQLLQEMQQRQLHDAAAATVGATGARAYIRRPNALPGRPQQPQQPRPAGSVMVAT